MGYPLYALIFAVIMGVANIVLTAAPFGESKKNELDRVPVSYTHLDVYKRQVVRTAEPAKSSSHESLIGVRQTMTVISPKPYIGPVSYTHLDVYKRQGIIFNCIGARQAHIGAE